MAEVSREIVMACTPERLFDVLVDYARYPEFVPGIKNPPPRVCPRPRQASDA